MATFCKTVLFIFFVKYFHFFNNAMAEQSVYTSLSLRLYKILLEIESIKTKVEQNENRIGDIENKISVYADFFKPTSTTDNKGQDMDGTALAQAVKTLASEKRILQETVGKTELQFGKFKSDILKEMTEFKICVKEQLDNDSKATESVHNSVNKSILAMSNDMSEFKANLTSLSAMYDTVSQDLQSVNVLVMENAKETVGVVNSSIVIRQNISALQADYDTTVEEFRQTLIWVQKNISEVAIIKPRTKSSFTASTAYVLSDGVLKYANVEHNEGSEFNNDTGTFTCRVPGLYLFIANVVEVGTDENYVDCWLSKNKDPLIYIGSRDGEDSTGSYKKNGHGTATGAATLHLSPGDSVYVWCHKETSKVWFSSFTGCLIAEDP